MSVLTAMLSGVIKLWVATLGLSLDRKLLKKSLMKFEQAKWEGCQKLFQFCLGMPTAVLPGKAEANSGTTRERLSGPRAQPYVKIICQLSEKEIITWFYLRTMHKFIFSFLKGHDISTFGTPGVSLMHRNYSTNNLSIYLNFCQYKQACPHPEVRRSWEKASFCCAAYICGALETSFLLFSHNRLDPLSQSCRQTQHRSYPKHAVALQQNPMALANPGPWQEKAGKGPFPMCFTGSLPTQGKNYTMQTVYACWTYKKQTNPRHEQHLSMTERLSQ